MGYVLGNTMFGASDLKIGTAAAIVGTCFLFVALSKVVDSSLILAASRMGADRAKPLKRSEGGGWDVDPSQSFEYFIILGEVDSSSHSSSQSSSSQIFSRAFCGCFEMTSRKDAFRDDTSDTSERERLRGVVYTLP
jgi:hypothetical protein